MTVDTTAHLNFRGQARAALEFYQSVFGGQITVATYGDVGVPKDAPGADDVVFGQVVADSGFRVMAYDVPGGGRHDGGGEGYGPVAGSAVGPAVGRTTRRDGVTFTTERFFLSVRGGSVEEVAALWEDLSDGAVVVEPFGPAQWAPAFGMLTDRFGITWILDVESGY